MTGDDARRTRHVLLVLVETRVDQRRRRTIVDTRRRYNAASTAAAVDAVNVGAQRCTVEIATGRL